MSNRLNNNPWGSYVIKEALFRLKIPGPEVKISTELLQRVHHLHSSTLVLETPTTFSTEQSFLTSNPPKKTPPPPTLSSPTQSSIKTDIVTTTISLPNVNKNLPLLPPSCNGTVLEPKPTTSHQNNHVDSNRELLSSKNHKQNICLDEFDKGHDDPFESAELNTLNDLEELRQVLSSSGHLINEKLNKETEEMEHKNIYHIPSPPQVALHEISFPRMEFIERQNSGNINYQPIPPTATAAKVSMQPQQQQKSQSYLHLLPISDRMNSEALYSTTVSMGFPSEHIILLLRVYDCLYHVADLSESFTSLQLPTIPLPMEQLVSDLLTLESSLDKTIALEDQIFVVILNSLGSKTTITSASSIVALRQRFCDLFYLFKKTTSCSLSSSSATTRAKANNSSDTLLKSCLTLAQLEEVDAKHILFKCTRY